MKFWNVLVEWVVVISKTSILFNGQICCCFVWFLFANTLSIFGIPSFSPFFSTFNYFLLIPHPKEKENWLAHGRFWLVCVGGKGFTEFPCFQLQAICYRQSWQLQSTVGGVRANIIFRGRFHSVQVFYKIENWIDIIFRGRFHLVRFILSMYSLYS